VALLDRETFLWLFETSSSFSRFLVGQFNERLCFFIGVVENDRMPDPTARIARLALKAGVAEPAARRLGGNF